MEQNGEADGNAELPTEGASSPREAGGSPQDAREPEGRGIPMRPGPDLILDERLNSAAAPFLYLLAIILTAVAGYFVYGFLRG